MKMNDLIVYYENGEIDKFEKIDIDADDLEGIVSPILNALIIDDQLGNQVCIFLDTVKKLEFKVVDE